MVTPPRNVVLLHGYGVTAGHEYLSKDCALDLEWYAPTSPRRLNGVHGTQPAWWYWDLSTFEHRLLEGFDMPDIIDPLVTPRGLPSVSQSLLEYLGGKEGGIRSTILGGHSQGAMLAVDAALFAADPPAGLIVMSGGVVAQRHWENNFHRLAGVPVLITHGENDGVLPIDGAQWLSDRMEEAGADVTFVRFEKLGHTTPPRELVHAWMEMNF